MPDHRRMRKSCTRSCISDGQISKGLRQDRCRAYAGGRSLKSGAQNHCLNLLLEWSEGCDGVRFRKFLTLCNALSQEGNIGRGLAWSLCQAPRIISSIAPASGPFSTPHIPESESILWGRCAYMQLTGSGISDHWLERSIFLHEKTLRISD